jgi:hypothetical protein
VACRQKTGGIGYSPVRFVMRTESCSASLRADWINDIWNRSKGSLAAGITHGEPRMNLKQLAAFEITTDGPLDSPAIERTLLNDIVQKLNGQGIECGRIKPGAFCVLSRCQVGDSLTAVGVLAIIRLSEHSARCGVACDYYVPWWRRLFWSSSVSLYSEEALRCLCAEVDRILASDPRVGRVKWMTREEFFGVWYRAR